MTDDRELKLPLSLPTVLKILWQEGLYKGKRKVEEKKRDLREVKKRLKAFEKMQVYVKYLDDIPELYAEYLHHHLPKLSRSVSIFRFLTIIQSLPLPHGAVLSCGRSRLSGLRPAHGARAGQASRWQRLHRT